MANTRWGIVLTGHKFDLLDWEAELRAPFDPWVDRVVTGDGAEAYVLRSEILDSETTAVAVYDAATAVVQELNGAMAITSNAQPVHIDGVYDFSETPPRRTIIISPASGSIRARATAAIVAVNAAGETIVNSPVPSQAQSWHKTAASHDHAADLMAYAARADNWFDIYKIFEAVAAILGSSHQIEKVCGKQAEDARTTANHYRHHRSTSPVRMSLDSARKEALRAAKIALEKLSE